MATTYEHAPHNSFVMNLSINFMYRKDLTSGKALALKAMNKEVIVPPDIYLKHVESP